MEKTAISYKCPSCGGELVFDAQKQLFYCQWCGGEFNDKQIDEIRLSEQMENEFADSTDVYVCSSCGAQIICDRNTAASFCYYCHSPVALAGRLTGRYRPEMLIPFRFSREQAEAAFRAHCRKKLFLPSDFLSKSQLEKITGLYVPFWLADCDIDAYMLATGKIIETRNTGSATYITTKIYDVDRAGKMTYMGVPADASRKIEDSLMDAIEPYDYKELQPFNMAYLSGFFCDKYDVDKEEVLCRIRKRIDESVLDVPKNDGIHYDETTIKSSKVNILSTKWHYMMLPVWFMTYKHNDRIYSFAMNGQTGKFAGKYPTSKLKLLLFAVIVAIAAGILGYAIGDMLI